MTDTTFVDYTTPVPATWLNDINDHVYNNTPISPATTVHPASVIANTPAGTIAATDVQTALNELDTEKLATAAIGTSVPSPTGTGASGTWGISITGNAATASDAAAHIALATAAHAATAISNTPAGNIAATTVQAAINELDTEKAALSGATFTGAITQSVVGASTRTILNHYRNAAASPNAGFTILSSRGDGVTASAVQSGDVLGYFMAGGDNGTAFASNKANITMYAAENWTATANGTALALSTTPAGSTTLAERMRIDSSGNVGVGYNTPSNFASAGLNFSIGTGAAAAALTVYTGTTSIGAVYFADSTSGVARYDGFIEYNQNTQSMALGYASASALTLDSTGVSVVKAILLGYGTGAGGTVTQATSKSTAVTLNKPCGQITMNNAALAAGASVTFDVNNSLVSSTDVISPTTVGSTGLNYRVDEAKTFSAGGGFRFTVTNITAGSLSEALVINFAVQKAVTA